MKMFHLYVIKTQICQNWRERKKQYRKRIASPEFSVSTYFGLLARLHWICCFERCHKTENFWRGTIHFKWKHVDDITTTILKLHIYCLYFIWEVTCFLFPTFAFACRLSRWARWSGLDKYAGLYFLNLSEFLDVFIVYLWWHWGCFF